MKVMVFGARGQLATALTPVLERMGADVVALAHAECDVTDGRQVSGQIERHRPDVVVNTAAYNQVDRCELEIERAFQANGFGPRLLAQACQRHEVALVHVSTNYVFDGHRQEPYDETDAVNPLSTYGLSKLLGELFVQRHCPQHLIIRTCGLFGRHEGREMGDNFVERILSAAASGRSLRVVNDQVLTPTYAGHAAEAIGRLLGIRARGLFHVTSSGQCSWWEFARAIVQRADLDLLVDATSSDAYGAAAPRPGFSVLRSHHRSLPELPDWQAGLDAYFRDRAIPRSPQAGMGAPHCT